MNKPSLTPGVVVQISGRDTTHGPVELARFEPLPETLIEPVSGWRLVDFAELWRSRELLYFFTWRDVLIRYKQTVLGAAWAIIQPVMMMLVFTVFLGRMAKVDSGGFPYPVFVYAGLLPWTFFSTAITRAGNSVVGAIDIVTKVYFPRLLVPFASVGAAAVDFALAFTVLVGLMVFYHVPLSWNLLLLPGLLVLLALAALGAGLILAALNAAYRDFKYMIPFLVQIWMFATPTVYMNVAVISDSAGEQQSGKTDSAGDVDVRGTEFVPATARQKSGESNVSVTEETTSETRGQDGKSLPASMKTLLHLNPMTGLIAFFRAATLGGPLPWRALGFSTLIIVTMFVCGVLYFRRVESRFADIL